MIVTKEMVVEKLKGIDELFQDCNYVAVDEDGEFYFYKHMPHLETTSWFAEGCCYVESFMETVHNWRECCWNVKDILGSQTVTETPIQQSSKKHSHYFKDVSNLDFIDVYRVLELFEVTNPCLQHAVKKLLCSGKRGAKDMDKDIQEAVDTLNRYFEMKKEME